MRKDHEDEIWEAEAAVAYSQAAESEFVRLKASLKRKAEEHALSLLPWYRRSWVKFKRLVGF